MLGAISLRFGYDGKNTDIRIKVFGCEIGNNKTAEKPSKEKKVKKEDSKTNPEKKTDILRTEVKTKEPVKKIIPEERKKVSEKTIISDWDNTENIKANPEIRKIKFSDIEEKEVKYKSAVEVKRIKMPEQQKEEIHEEAEKVTEEKEPEKLSVKYFINMPPEDRKKLIKALVKLIKSLLRGVKPKDLMLKGTVGLSDPSLTGQIVGGAWALNGMFNKKIEVEAAFNREVIEGECKIKGRIVPIAMMFYIIRFIIVKPVRNIILLLVKGDKNGK